MAKPDWRTPPLRKIASTHAERDGSLYDRLECGHRVPRDDFAGAKRRRCADCWRDEHPPPNR